jgi:hypothetical protein
MFLFNKIRLIVEFTVSELCGVAQFNVHVEEARFEKAQSHQICPFRD